MELTNETLIKMQYSPFSASVHWDPMVDTVEDWEQYYEVSLQLPRRIRYGLIDSHVIQANQNMLNRYQVSDLKKVGEVSRIIREIFIKNLREEEIKTRLRDRVGLAAFDVEHFMVDLKQIVALVKKVGLEESQKGVEQLTIIEALKKYPALGEQRLGTKFLNIKQSPSPVPPSLKNWLEDYFSQMSTNKHDAMERSEYLFKTSNAKILDAEDRENLNVLLRSYDMSEPLFINTEDQTIIFSESRVDQPAMNQLRAFAPPAAAKENQSNGIDPEDNIIIKSETYNSVKTPQLKPLSLKTSVDQKDLNDVNTGTEDLKPAMEVPLPLTENPNLKFKQPSRIAQPIEPLASNESTAMVENPVNEPINLKDLPPKPNKNEPPSSPNVVDLSQYL